MLMFLKINEFIVSNAPKSRFSLPLLVVGTTCEWCPVEVIQVLTLICAKAHPQLHATRVYSRSVTEVYELYAKQMVLLLQHLN